MNNRLRDALAGTLVALAACSAWAAEVNAAAATRAPITPEMVRSVAGPPRPDNGQLEVQPGLPPKKCSKEDKHADAAKPGRPDKSEKRDKTGRRKGHC